VNRQLVRISYKFVCKEAGKLTAEHGGKPWKYVLIPLDKVAKNNSFKGIIAEYIM